MAELDFAVAPAELDIVLPEIYAAFTGMVLRIHIRKTANGPWPREKGKRIGGDKERVSLVLHPFYLSKIFCAVDNIFVLVTGVMLIGAQTLIFVTIDLIERTVICQDRLADI